MLGEKRKRGTTYLHSPLPKKLISCHRHSLWPEARIHSESFAQDKTASVTNLTTRFYFHAKGTCCCCIPIDFQVPSCGQALQNSANSQQLRCIKKKPSGRINPLFEKPSCLDNPKEMPTLLINFTENNCRSCYHKGTAGTVIFLC